MLFRGMEERGDCSVGFESGGRSAARPSRSLLVLLSIPAEGGATGLDRAQAALLGGSSPLPPGVHDASLGANAPQVHCVSSWCERWEAETGSRVPVVADPSRDPSFVFAPVERFSSPSATVG